MVLEQDREQREQSLRIQQARANRVNEERERKIPDEEDIKREQQRIKNQKLKDEKSAIEQIYQDKLKSIKVPKNTLQRSNTHAAGKVLRLNPEYQKAVNILSAERDRALASINIRESGVQVKRITLSRTASKVMRGESRSSDYHVAYQVGVATANRELYSGKLSPTEYKTRLSKLSRSYKDAQNAFTKRNTPSAASLRATGNTQVYSGIDKELKRLGGQGLGGNNNQGPTMVSDTLQKTSPKIGDRVPIAPGVAAKSQDFSKEFKHQPQVQSAPRQVSPQKAFAAIATAGTSFGKVQPQITVDPLRKGESIHNRINPLLIPASQRSDIGYSPAGKPMQGPLPQQQRYSVTDSSGNVRTFKDLETAQKFAGRTAKEAVTPVNIAGLIPPSQSQKPELRLTPTGKIQHGLSKTLDDIARFKTGNKYVDSAYSAIIGHPVGSVRSVVEGVNVLDNLGKHEIPKYLGMPVQKGLDPIPIQRTGDEVVLPIAIDNKGIRAKSFGEIKTDVSAYAKKYSTGDLVGGAISTYVPIGMGIKSGVGTLKNIATKKVTPKLVGAATSETKLIGSAPVIKKVPLTVKERVPNIGKDQLLDTLKTRQQSVSGTSKLPEPYKPSSKPVVRSGVVPPENIKGKITLSKGFIPNKPDRISKPFNPNKPVGSDPYYKPAKRTGEIDVSDGALAGIKQTRVSLGVGITKSPTKTVRSGIRKPVEVDPYYKPAKRTGEIDVSDGALAGIKQTRIKLGTGAVKTPSGVKPPKKLDFSNPWRVKPRKFDDPKIDKGDKLVGGRDGSIQIVKAKTDVVKLKKKQVTPVKIAIRTESIAKTPRMASSKPVTFLVKPKGALMTRKKKPVKTRQESSPVYETVYTRRTAAKAAGIVSMASIPSIFSSTSYAQSNKTKIFSSSKLSSPQKQPSASKTKQPIMIKQSQPQKPQLKSPQKTKSVTRQKTRLQSKPRISPRLRTQQNIRPPPRRKPPAGALPFFDSDDRKRRKKGEKRADFLGNVRLGSIEGFVKRKDITYGRKKIGKIIRKDPTTRGRRIFG